MAKKEIHLLKEPVTGNTQCGIKIKKVGRGYNTKLTIEKDKVTCEDCKKAIENQK